MTKNDVENQFRELIKALDEQGWNEDIIDDLKILKKKYRRDRDNY